MGRKLVQIQKHIIGQHMSLSLSHATTSNANFLVSELDAIDAACHEQAVEENPREHARTI